MDSIPMIRLFGKCSFEHGGAAIEDLKCARSRELLGYLACNRNRDLPREVVVETLWGDMQEEQGKRALRQTLWQLQSALGPFHITARRPLIEADGEWLRLNSNSGIWIDVEKFEGVEKLTRLKKGEPVPADHQGNLREGVTLYSGQLLEGCFSDWCVNQRNILQQKYMKMLSRLMFQQRRSNDIEGAMATALLLLEEEPASEQAHGMIMVLHYRDGDRTSALRQFQRYKQIMRDEFNVRKPSVIRRAFGKYARIALRVFTILRELW
jgi:DNA-binding SARP family transcriptional activator